MKYFSGGRKYSRISAINSEIAVKLSEKQLANQKAEFLLR